MVRKGEVGLAHTLSMFQAHPWLFFKVKMLERVLQNFGSWFPEITVEDEGPSLVHEMIRLEIVVTTVHYAEVFAANLLAFKRKQKRFHKTLLSYRGSEIIDFYKKIKHRSLSYIANLLGYPALFQIRDKQERELLIRSCKYVKEKLSEIGCYYLKHLSLYNAYKHGFRVAVAEQAPPPEMVPADFEPYAFIMWPPKEKKLDVAIVMRCGDPKIEIEMCSSMCGVLNAVTNTFTERILRKKQTFTATVFQ